MAKIYTGSLIMPVSGNCNLSCAYCYRAQMRDNNVKRMSFDVLERFIAQYIELNPVMPSFGWQGGEPLLAGLDFYKKVIELQCKYKKSNTAVSNSIQTNATLVNDGWAKFFKENDFLVGVSIDGPSEYHDSLRVDSSGGPTLKRVLRGVGYLRKYDVDFNILLTINKYNVKHAVKVFRYLINKGFYYVQLIPVTDFNDRGEPSAYTITPDEYTNFICTILNEWIKLDNPSVYVNIIDILLHSYLGYKPPYCVFNRLCDKMITVDYNGDVYPCDFFAEEKYKIGNIMESDINDMFKMQSYKSYIGNMHALPDECKVCRWFFTCHGGCMRHMDVFKKGVKENYFCRSYKKIFEYYFDTFNRVKNSPRNSNLRNFLLSLQE
ncbi:MAG: anaerobic sulfatase maturase [Clostridiales bacterium]|nr:anaerobic sulfatase maturase [Clostridiales bacterium]